MPAEIHKQILDYQGGDANAALELVEKFKPLIKRYAFFLHREDSFEDLQCFLLSMLKTWDTSRLSSTDDATVTRHIANSVKNEYIALSKQMLYFSAHPDSTNSASDYNKFNLAPGDTLNFQIGIFIEPSAWEEQSVYLQVGYDNASGVGFSYFS